jgi:hypothetical protein
MEDTNVNSFQAGVNAEYAGSVPMPPQTDMGMAGSSPNPIQVKERFTGIAPGPLPSQVPKGSSKNFDPKANIAAMQEWHDATVKDQEDHNEWAKIYSYNSGPTGTFYDRYSGIQEAGKIEFHPLRDNEAILNRNTNFFGDMYRTLSQTFVPMIGAGIKSVYASTGKLINEGDFFGEDARIAEEHAKLSALTYSSKNNLGSFVNNLTNNLGYTIGIMATAMGENMVGAAVGGLIGARAIGPKAANLLWKEYQAGKSFDGIATYAQKLDQLKDINKVREAWNKVNGIGKIQRGLQSGVGRVLNPLSNLTDNYYGILNSTDDFTGYMKTAGLYLKTAGSAYRDFRNINLALAEARLESGMVYNNLIGDIYKDYQIKYGRNPNNDEMQDIVAQAKQAAYETSAMNAGLIYFSNKLAFDNILNPRVGAQGVLRQKMLDWKTVGGGRFGELGTIGFDVAKNEWKFAEKGFKTWWNKWKTEPLHKSVWGTVGYLKTNLTEGVQESLQETIASANEKYYKDTFYSHPVRKNLVSKAVFGKGTTPLSYYSQELGAGGFSTFASGFAMGALAGGLNSTMTYLYEKANQIFDPKTFEEYKTEKSKIVEELVNQMNGFGVEEMINSRVFNGGTQDILAKVQNSGNKKEVMDAESESLIQHFMMLNDYGVLDMYLDAVESYKDMTNDEFKEAFPKLAGEDINKYKSRITGVVTQARDIQKRMDFYNKVYPNPIDLNKISKDSEDYEQAYIMHHSWNYGVKSAVFYNEVFDNARERMVEIMNKHYQERPLQSMTKRQSDIILRPEEMRNEIGLLKNEANNLIAVGDPESKQMAKDKLKEAEALEKYSEAYQEFTEYYHRDRYFNRAKAILQQDKEEGAEVTDQEVNQFLEDRFGPKNEEVETKILLNLEDQYKNLLKTISGKPDDYLFTENIDNAFELVLDFYKLNDESREMVDMINLMNDPNGFLDVYYRNEKWMTDLWLKRGDYYREIATQELSQIEDNGLLNFLANRGIFMEGNDFLLWRDQGIPPKEFYDERKGLVVPEGSLAYDRYMETLERYQTLKDIEGVVTETAKNAELQLRISQLQERKDKQLEKLEVQFEENLLATTGENKEAWLQKEIPPAPKSKKEIQDGINDLNSVLKLVEDANDVSTLFDLYETMAQQNIVPENFTELAELAIQNNPEESSKFFKSTKKSGASVEDRQRATLVKFGLQQILLDKIAQAKIEQESADIEQEAVPPIETTDAWKDYQQQIKKTNERYAALIKKLKDQLTEAPAQTQPVTTEAPKKESRQEVDLNATWNDLPDDLRNELEIAFDAYLVAPAPAGLGKPADFRRIDPIRYELIRNNWLERPEQKDIIKAYNERPIDEESALPKIKYLPLTKSITEYGLTQLRIMRDKLQSMYDRNKYDNGDTLTNNDRNAIKNDISELQKYLTYLRSIYKPKDNTNRVFRIFEEMVKNKQNGVSRILDAEGNTVGYEFPGVDGKPMRVTKLTEEIENKMTNKDPYLYEAIKEPYMEGKVQRGGQLLIPFRDLVNDTDIASDAERLNRFMSFVEYTVKDGKLAQLNSQRKLDIIRNALTNNFTEAALIAVVKDVANDESTIAGNTIDNMTRVAFRTDKDGGFIKPEKPAKMSQQAYDNLFGDYGIITELQDSVIDGKYKILSDDVIIYDSTLLESGLVGAMDLVAFDTETGDLKIIDIKTGKPENWTNFNDDSKFNKKLTYRIQQSLYRALLYNMTGELAKSISILPISITTDMDGNILSAESAAKVVNGPVIRDLKNTILSIEKSSKPDANKIKELENKVEDLERAKTVPLEPVDDATLAEYGVVMKLPNLPEDLKPENVGQETKKPKLTEEQKTTEVKKLKKKIAEIFKKLADIPNGGMISVGDMVTTSPQYEQLLAKKNQLEEEILKILKGGAVEEKDPIDEELDALKRNFVDNVFPELVSLTSEEFKNILDRIKSAEKLEDLEAAYTDAIVAITAETDIQFADLVENVYQIRKNSLKLSTSEENIAEGDYLISKKPIFGITENEVVIVKSKGDGKIVINQVENVKNGKPKKKTFTETQIKAGFTKTTEEALKVEEEIMEPTPEEKENSEISKSSLKNFADNPELIEKAKQNAASMSKKDRLAALKNKSKDDNINKCNPK